MTSRKNPENGMVECEPGQVFYLDSGMPGDKDDKYIITLEASSEQHKNINVFIIRTYLETIDAYYDNINVYWGPYVSYFLLDKERKQKAINQVFTHIFDKNG